jgi:hypothetical protein
MKDVHAAALKQLEAHRDAGRLSPDDYKKIEGTTGLQDYLDSVDDAITQYAGVHRRAGRVPAVVRSLLQRLKRFESAIDMLAQSSPSVMGLNLVGLIWGSLKVLLIVSRWLYLIRPFLIWLRMV